MTRPSPPGGGGRPLACNKPAGWTRGGWQLLAGVPIRQAPPRGAVDLKGNPGRTGSAAEGCCCPSGADEGMGGSTPPPWGTNIKPTGLEGRRSVAGRAAEAGWEAKGGGNGRDRRNSGGGASGGAGRGQGTIIKGSWSRGPDGAQVSTLEDAALFEIVQTVCCEEGGGRNLLQSEPSALGSPHPCPHPQVHSKSTQPEGSGPGGQLGRGLAVVEGIYCGIGVEGAPRKRTEPTEPTPLRATVGFWLLVVIQI